MLLERERCYLLESLRYGMVLLGVAAVGAQHAELVEVA